MGTDISGWVEGKRYDEWYGIVYLRHYLHRDYDAFACLFGVTNHARFTPIASNRGIPQDASEETYSDEFLYMDSTYGQTWISLDEIEAIDWNEYAKKNDKRVIQYHRDENGHWIKKYKSRLPHPEIIDRTREGKTQVGEILYEVRRMQRQEVYPYWSNTVSV
ncbi:MAG: hypothetical protein Phog2KO_48670 [Phototrophicaceae bacterium]